jgi:hypothetical protein
MEIEVEEITINGEQVFKLRLNGVLRPNLRLGL